MQSRQHHGHRRENAGPLDMSFEGLRPYVHYFGGYGGRRAREACDQGLIMQCFGVSCFSE